MAVTFTFLENGDNEADGYQALRQNQIGSSGPGLCFLHAVALVANCARFVRRRRRLCKNALPKKGCQD